MIDKRLGYLIFSCITVIVGFVIIGFLLVQSYINALYSYAIYFSLAVVNILFLKLSFSQAFYELVLNMSIFPFYPLIRALGMFSDRPVFRPFKSEEFQVKLSEIQLVDVSDFAPVLIISKYGDTFQKKAGVRLIVELIKEEKIDINQSIQLLKELQKDQHPDVVMYASDAMTELDNYFLQKIEESKDRIDDPDYLKKYGSYADYYIKSGLVSGIIKDNLLKNVISVFEKRLEKLSFRFDIVDVYLTLIETSGRNPLEPAIRFKEILATQPILEKAILYSIKYNKLEITKKLIKEFLEKGFSPEHPSLKFLLENQ
ncbi:MAG TPA: hypothetical protein PLI28_03600 [Petrotogaceae bacterium]|jgi:hypothetical protein|nr:hypothetical protein [Petrotogaceae bacterium]HOG33875.1 hypothetical protein [Petrotogaceae bacterium]HQO12542.1 hypothetical protein [Petrotogaceae bacterium]HQP58038.1 hypothetical protein [Petrotogaceae bacterium]